MWNTYHPFFWTILYTLKVLSLQLIYAKIWPDFLWKEIERIPNILNDSSVNDVVESDSAVCPVVSKVNDTVKFDPEM